jgi:hypothetical protein
MLSTSTAPPASARGILRPKTLGGRGFLVSKDAFLAGIRPVQALMIGTSEQITAKILDAHHILGGLDRSYGQTDWGGLPPDAVEGSITRLATEIAPPSAPCSDIVVGHVTMIATCVVGFLLRLPPTATGVTATLALLATFVFYCVQSLPPRRDWDAALSRLVAGKCPPAPADRLDRPG